MRRLLALLFALVLVPAAAAQARVSLVEVPVGGPLTAPTLERLGFDVTHDSTEEAVRVLLHDDADRRRLAAAGYPSTEVLADVEAYHARARALDGRQAALPGRSALPSGRDLYRTLDEYYAELDGLAAAHPGLVRRTDLPRASVQGRKLAGVEIASGVNRSDDGRPVYVVMGAHHAREWPSAEVNLEFALDLARGYGTDPRITRLLDRVRVFVFPVINPDGFVVSRGSLPAVPGPDPLQRKNAAEVDLNRNYGAFWGGNGASTDPANDTYRGPAPWSEPETKAVHEFSQRLHITNFQSIHNIAALVLRPPGFKALGLAPDEARLKDLGDRMGAATGYSSEYGYQLYEVTGATEDWNYVAQNAFGYTIELGPGGAPGTFQGPYQTHVVEQYLGADGQRDDGDGVREALLLAGEQAGDVRDHAVLDGSAPAGATLRLTKTFKTATSPICQADQPDTATDCSPVGAAMLLDDGLDTQLTVPASGRFEWHVAPSTRPFERKAGRTESWSLVCTGADGRELARRPLEIAIGERRSVEPCVAPSVSPSGPAVPATGATRRGPGLTFRVARRQRRSTVLRRGVLVRATCVVDCSLRTAVRRSLRTRRLGRRTVALRAGRQRALRIRLTARSRRYVRRRGLRRVAVRLEARGAGARQVVARGVRLTR